MGCWRPQWPPAGLVNTHRSLDTQSPENDNEDTPKTFSHSHTQLTLPPSYSDAQSHM